MSKHKNELKVYDFSTEKRSAEYITTGGMHVILHGIPPLLIPDIVSSVVFPTVPTYTVVTASGDTQTFPHDETTITTDEDKVAWSKYKEQLDVANSEMSTKMIMAILEDGVEIDDDILIKWKKRQKRMGLLIPEDEDDCIIACKRNLIVSSADDIKHIMDIVMNLTGVSEEVVESTKKAFPDSLQSDAPG
jgi:hypothetical protein